MEETKVKQLTLEDLEQQLKNGDAKIEDFNSVYKNLQDALLKFQQQVEYATTLNLEKEKKFKSLNDRLVGHNASTLMEKLRGQGFYLRKNKGIREAFERIGYRILEKTRAGKRSEVYHTILRIFITQKQEIPKILNEPFKPLYSIEMFKVFLFSFLGGILGHEKEMVKPD